MSVEWVHVAIVALAGCVAALGGLMGGVWRVAHIEQGIRDDFKTEVADVENELRDQMKAVELRLADKVDGLSDVFDETLKGLRQKINDVELEMVRNYVSIPYFDGFRKEHREDMQRIMDKLDGIPRAS